MAEHLTLLHVPTLYRIHEPPTAEKVTQFNTFMRAFGYALPEAERLQPRDVQTLLDEVRGTPEEQLVNHLLLRSLQRARYTTHNAGHFGLAFAYYTHFTSPIRRYPDLIVHRLLRETARTSGMTPVRREFWASRLPVVAEHTSTSERQADEAERDAVGLKKIEFMRHKIGEEYAGMITGVTPFGLFVELEELFVEGLVHISWLPDYFIFYEERLCLVGQKTGQIYRLGDRVHIRVDNVSLARKQIDFSLLAKY